MTDEIYLKPCPFCGSEPTHFPVDKLWYYIYCSAEDCTCRIVGRKREDAVRMWNNRATVGSDDDLLVWVDTWLDCARFDNRLTKEEQDACWTVLNAVARLQEGERMTKFDKDPRYIYTYNDWLARYKNKESKRVRHYPDCVRGHPILETIYDRTRDEWTEMAATVRRASE